MSTEASVVREEQLPATTQRGMIDVASSRQAQEVQAMILLAKKFPRDENEAIQRITTACQRVKLAEVSMYQYSRGGTDITGPSIRMAECLAQNWGNIEHGLKELSQDNGESVVEAYAWDMQTNYRASKVFTVKHVRATKRGTYALTDPRDIYELVANVGARRVRACILAVIPKDVQDLAIEQCEKTLTQGHKEPLVDRVRKMLAAFAEYGVTQQMLEQRCQRKLASFTEQNLLALRKIFTSLKDGMSVTEEWFTFEDPTPAANAGESRAEKQVREMKQRKTKEPKPTSDPASDSAEAAESEPERDIRQEVCGLNFFPDYEKALANATTDLEVRTACTRLVLPQKDELPPEYYAELLRMRDEMIKYLASRK